MYIVIEIQKGSEVATIVNSYASKPEAEARYHAVLAAAAVSKVPVHSAVMMTAEGQFVKSETYKHEVTA